MRWWVYSPPPPGARFGGAGSLPYSSPCRIGASRGGGQQELGFREGSGRALLNTMEVEAHSRNATAHAAKRSFPTASPAACRSASSAAAFALAPRGAPRPVGGSQDDDAEPPASCDHTPSAPTPTPRQPTLQWSRGLAAAW